MLLQAAYGSWTFAGMGFLCLLASLLGGVLAAWIDGGNVTLATVAGLLAVLAVALRHQLMLVGRVQGLQAGSDGELTREVVAEAAEDRFDAVVTSVALTALALLPVVFFGSIAGQEIVKPMAVVIIGGLITTVLVSLFVTPGLYLRFGPRAEAVQPVVAADVPVAATSVQEPVGTATFSWPEPSATPSPTEG